MVIINYCNGFRFNYFVRVIEFHVTHVCVICYTYYIKLIESDIL